jgi:hypothetical protein
MLRFNQSQRSCVSLSSSAHSRTIRTQPLALQTRVRGKSSAQRALRRKCLLTVMILACIPRLSHGDDGWAVGLFAGELFPQSHFGQWWNASPQFGISCSYPFHPRIRVETDGYFCSLQPNKIQASMPGLRNLCIMMARGELSASIPVFQNISFSPLVVAGFNGTIFFMYSRTRRTNENVESEIGMHAGAGVRYRINSHIQIQASFREYAIFSEPFFIWYAATIAGIQLYLPGTKK